MKLYERIENNNFDEIDKNRAIELIEGGNGHLVYNENHFKLQKEYEKALAEYMEWQKQELDQKDKIIDLMAETINNHDIDEDICKQMGQKANCNEFEDTEKCKECIKQYFENKAKEIK